MRKVLFAAAACVAVVLSAAAPVSAGKEPPELVATPNPAEVGDVVTVANVDEPSSTCENPDIAAAAPAAVVLSRVAVLIEDPDGIPIVDEVLGPDLDGNWSVEFTATKAGEYVVEAACLLPLEIEGSSTMAVPPFDYASLVISVSGGTTTTPTTAGTSSTTGETRADTSSRPRFTG